jgi:sugar lactone lactonase YvrE
MQRFLACVVLLLLPAITVAQDMPLSQVLIEGEGWKPSGKAEYLDVDVRDAKGNRYQYSPNAREIVHFPPKTESKIGKIISMKRTVGGMAVTRAGTLYFTAPDEQAVYSYRPGGKPGKITEGVARPTGISLWPDDGTLVVADAAGKHVYAYRVEKDGSLTCKEGYCTLRLPAGQKESGAAGMCMDTAGRLYVATTVGVQCFDPTGRLNGVLLNPSPAPPRVVAFDGPALEVLHMLSDRVYTRQTKAKGLPPPEK